MKLKDVPSPVWYMGGAVVAILVVGYFVKKGAGAAADVAKTVGNAINPLNDKNVFYSGTNDALQALGIVDQDSSLGSQIYDWVHSPGNTGQAGGSDTSGSWASVFSHWFGSSDTSKPYDYGQGGSSGIPYAPGVNSTPDVFNLTNYNWTQ